MGLKMNRAPNKTIVQQIIRNVYFDTDFMYRIYSK